MFACPWDNPGPAEPLVAQGQFSVRCHVCGFLSDAPRDLDERDDHISAELQFGPNALNGAVDESEVLGYLVFLTDACGHKIGAAVAAVQVQDTPTTTDSCCQSDVYKVSFTAQLPFNTSSVALMVVPNTTAGLLPVGASTSPVIDRRRPVTTRKGIVGSSSSATMMVVSRWLLQMCITIFVAS